MGGESPTWCTTAGSHLSFPTHKYLSLPCIVDLRWPECFLYPVYEINSSLCTNAPVLMISVSVTDYKQSFTALIGLALYAGFLNSLKKYKTQFLFVESLTEGETYGLPSSCACSH